MGIVGEGQHSGDDGADFIREFDYRYPGVAHIESGAIHGVGNVQQGAHESSAETLMRKQCDSRIILTSCPIGAALGIENIALLCQKGVGVEIGRAHV